jgi:hypothetical protein
MCHVTGHDPNFNIVCCDGYYKSREGARKMWLSNYWCVDYANTITYLVYCCCCTMEQSPSL